jgi:hypothetical protein
MNKCTRRTLWIVVALLVLLAVAVFLRSKAPPEAARLLPESDGIVYFDLKPLRSFFRKDLKPPQHVPEYQQFINAVGIDPERDLDEAAIALHRMSDPNGPNGPVAYSMVLVGKITGQRLNTWLDANATAREFYAGHTIYSIPSDGRTVRVAQIGYNMLAVSNTPTPEQIHSMLDRHSTAAWPFAGSTLLRQHYSDVPLLSLAWGVGQIGLPFSESGAINILGFPLHLADNSTLVASIAPELPMAGALRVRIEEIAPNDVVANSQASALITLVFLARNLTAPLADNPANNGLKEMLNTAKITVQKRNRVVVTATLSHSLFSVPAASGGTPPALPASPGTSK